jgi:hypothetical protein
MVIEINYTPNGLETGPIELNLMAIQCIVMRNERNGGKKIGKD